MINKDKSAVMFSQNTSRAKKEEFMRELNLQRETVNDRYLGLPVYIGRSKMGVFAYLKDRIWQRIQGWKEKLSRTGKEVLIKAVAQAIPTFAMGCFDLTKDICEQISKMIARYWWSNQEKENKMYWLSWEKLTEPKWAGGLGFRDIHAFNLAMLAKQGWRLIQNPESLCAQVLKAKYYPSGNIFSAKKCANMSYTWRSICRGLLTLRDGMIWRVGNGAAINIWSDPWIPRDHTRRPITPRGRNLVTRVEELIDPSTGSWDVELLTQTFWPEDVNMIRTIPVHIEMDDMLAWHYDEKGLFSVKSAYKVQRDGELQRRKRGSAGLSNGSTEREMYWKKVWKMQLPGKVKHFIWRFSHNILALRVNLQQRGMDLDSRCIICNRMNEDAGHLFFKCKKVKKVWQENNLEILRQELAEKRSGREVMETVFNRPAKEILLASITLWQWWSERNRVQEGERGRSPSELGFIIAALAEEYMKLNKKDSKRAPSRNEKWSRTDQGVMKINTDGAFDPFTRTGGWGFAIRDHSGKVVKSGAGKVQILMNAFHAEALACAADIRAASECGMQRVTAETDSTMLKSALEKNTFASSALGGIICEIKNFVNFAFLSFNVSYCP